MAPVRTIDAAERRARLARRHALAPDHHVDSVIEATRRMVCLHATDPSTVYLSAWARVPGMTVADLERALYRERSLVKHMAMRRTLFVFARETLAMAQAAASNRVATAESGRLARDVEKSGLQSDGAVWLQQASAAVLSTLSDGREATSTELRDELPVLQGTTTYGEGKAWGGEVPVGPRVLTCLSAAGGIVRASNDGRWTTSRPRWSATQTWLGEPIDVLSFEDGTAALVREWLAAFGPGTVADIKWWLGSTVAAVKRALVELEAVEVDLDGSVGYVLADDVDPVDEVAPWAALLPSLDPTIMGWFERGWYLGPHRDQLFDRNGNAGHSAWWDGRVVGGWRQDDGGTVKLQLLEDVGREGRAALAAQADRLTAWLDGVRTSPRFPSPLTKAP